MLGVGVDGPSGEDGPFATLVEQPGDAAGVVVTGEDAAVGGSSRGARRDRRRCSADRLQ